MLSSQWIFSSKSLKKNFLVNYIQCNILSQPIRIWRKHLTSIKEPMRKWVCVPKTPPRLTMKIQRALTCERKENSPVPKSPCLLIFTSLKSKEISSKIFTLSGPQPKSWSKSATNGKICKDFKRSLTIN